MSTRRHRRLAALAAATVVLASCSGSGPATSATSATNARAPARTLDIVAGENFWGSIVAQLAGKVGRVTSVVSDPNADPHTYEINSDDARAFAAADYVVLDGAGYDSWADKLLSGNPNSKRKVLTVANLLGKKEGDNPHFWYSPEYVATVTDQIEADLKSLAPADAAYFDAQRGAFDTAMAPVNSRRAEIRSGFAGVPVASTESIVVYLAQDLGLDLISPPEFMQAVAEGNDPPAPSATEFQDLITRKLAKVLVYNLQTSTVVTTNLKKLAARVGIPTVGVTETIQPPDATYQQWFGAQLLSLQSALAASDSAQSPPTSAP